MRDRGEIEQISRGLYRLATAPPLTHPDWVTVSTRIPQAVIFWPFDGWEVPREKSGIVEVYPRLWSGLFPRENRTSDQHDAWSIAEWMRRNDRSGHLAAFLEPGLSVPERRIAEIAGWILGTVSPIG